MPQARASQRRTSTFSPSSEIDRNVTMIDPMNPMVVASASPTSRIPSTNSRPEQTWHTPRASCSHGARLRNGAPGMRVVSSQAISRNTM